MSDDLIFKIFSLCVLTALFSITNRIRGDDNRPKLLPKKTAVYAFEAAVLWFITFMVGFEHHLYVIPSYFFTRWLCSAFGWGKYFPHAKQNYYEKEFAPVDWIMDRFMPWKGPRKAAFVKRWKTIAMSLRFLLTFGVVQVPLFAYLFSNIWILPLGLLAYALMGPVYRIALELGGDLSECEYGSGALMGFFFGLSILIAF